MTSLLSHDEDMVVTSYEDQCEIVYTEQCYTKHVAHSTPLFKKHCHKPAPPYKKWKHDDVEEMLENEEVNPLAKLDLLKNTVSGDKYEDNANHKLLTCQVDWKDQFSCHQVAEQGHDE